MTNIISRCSKPPNVGVVGAVRQDGIGHWQGESLTLLGKTCNNNNNNNASQPGVPGGSVIYPESDPLIAAASYGSAWLPVCGSSACTQAATTCRQSARSPSIDRRSACAAEMAPCWLPAPAPRLPVVTQLKSHRQLGQVGSSNTSPAM